MEKFKLPAAFILLLLLTSLWLGKINYVQADWWERPETRPSQPGFSRDQYLPTQPEPTATPVVPTATTVPSQPTVTPRVGGLPTATPTPTTVSEAEEDPCASGKSFVGPYCGWSPRVGGDEGGGGGDGGGQAVSQDVGQVLGLSTTSSRDLMPSDIILLIGVLCLLLYARSKLSTAKLV